MQSGEYRNLTKKELDGLLEGKTSLDPRKKFGAALRKEKEEKARRRAEKQREEFK